MFFYKKQPNGNYTFGGVAKELMDDAEEYFNMRSGEQEIEMITFNIFL